MQVTLIMEMKRALYWYIYLFKMNFIDDSISSLILRYKKDFLN